MMGHDGSIWDEDPQVPGWEGFGGQIRIFGPGPDCHMLLGWVERRNFLTFGWSGGEILKTPALC